MPCFFIFRVENSRFYGFSFSDVTDLYQYHLLYLKKYIFNFPSQMQNFKQKIPIIFHVDKDTAVNKYFNVNSSFYPLATTLNRLNRSESLQKSNMNQNPQSLKKSMMFLGIKPNNPGYDLLLITVNPISCYTAFLTKCVVSFDWEYLPFS